jgi:hypothetical protein
MIPRWLHTVSIVSLVVAGVICIVVAIDVYRYRQHMWIMNVVWPVTMLFGSLLTGSGYLRYGRLATHKKAMAAMHADAEPPHKSKTPFPIKVAKGTLHCGSGCTLGDISAEWLLFAFPVIATWFGWKTIFDEKIFAAWIVDYIFAFGFGIAFQYFTLKPMRDLSVREGLLQAAKVDVASLTAWQIGMYGFMAFAHFHLFRHVLGAPLAVNSVEFWFLMQIAMGFGFLTSYPVNWLLIRKGIKEAM